MLTKIALPVIAVLLALFAIYFVAESRQAPPNAAPPVPPPRTPYSSTIAGAGIIESQSRDVAIGSPTPGIVVEVNVAEGDQVKKGAPLFRLDDRALRATLAVRQAALESAKAQLEKMANAPRPEEVPVSEAYVDAAKATLQQQDAQVVRSRQLIATRAISEEELESSIRDDQVARAEYERTKAQLDLLKAGTWKYDLDIYRAAVASAQAQVDETEIDLDRLIVRAPIDCQILQLNVRVGEYVGAPPGQALLMVGDTSVLHVRVDIDEFDAARFKPDAPAVAMRRGRAGESFPLTFVRVDPMVIPKKSLTGENTERVDTRVLQVIYKIDTKDQRLYVGQQMDVFIDAAPTSPP